MIPLTDLLVRIAIISLALVALVGGIAVAIWALEAEKTFDYTASARMHAELGLPGGGGPIVMLVIGPLYCLILFILVKHALDEAERPLIRVVVGTLFVLLISTMLFMLKVYRQRFYAILEFCFAVAVTAQTLWNLHDVIEPVEALSLLSAAYLSIRAMDNFKKGLEAAKKVQAVAAA
jgi:hypothetical protein